MNLERFKEEMALAKRAPDRDTRVEHLRKALEYRPNAPDNLRIEFQIGIELQQRYDPKYPDQKPKPAEALPVFLGIVERYKHMDYYELDPLNQPHSPLTMVPGAAILAAGEEYVLNGDEERARELVFFAMDCLKETMDRRISDWRNAPYPPAPDADAELIRKDPQGDWKRDVEQWQARQDRAAQGDVLNEVEVVTAQASVQVFSMSMDEWAPEERAVGMDEIIRRYPNTPMAKFAAEEKENILQAALEVQPLPSVPVPAPPTDESWGVKVRGPSGPPAAASVGDFGVKTTAAPVVADAPAPATLTPAEPSKQRSVADWLAPLLAGIIIAIAAALYIYTRRRA